MACGMLLGWLIFRSRHVSDGRMKRIISETFAIVYPIQVKMLAQIA